MASKLDIPLDGASINIVTECESDLRNILQHKFGCTIVGLRLRKGQSIAQQKRPTVIPERRFETVLPSGVKVSVWKADLTDFSVAAVVNAANAHLKHGGGLAGALSEVGGPKIQKDSDEYIKKHGPLKTGDAIVSDAGQLKCQKIIHAVGPDLEKYPTGNNVAKAEPLLQKAICSILLRVKEHHLDTVAIPAISSGLFHYPLHKCADTIVTAVKHYFERSNSHECHPREVFFVNNDEPTVKEMDRACRVILANTVKSYSQAAASHSKGAAKTSTSTAVIRNVRVILRKGNIEEQQTDVIVNSTSVDRNLGIGLISKALLQKAGPKMQDEMYRASVNGKIIITNGYKLKCKEVFHTYCSDQYLEGIQQNFSKSVLECLWMATLRNHRSIAFPAIGTGNLGFHKSEAARIMLNAVVDFAQSVQKQTEVHFVIFPSDDDTFKAFEGEMKSLQNKASHSNFSQVWHGQGSSDTSKGWLQRPPTQQQAWKDIDGNGAPSAQISLRGPSDETTCEAVRWFSDIFNNPFNSLLTICNNFILYFGERDFQQLSRQTKRGMQMEEFLEKGRAGIILNGNSMEDLAVVAIQVEAILCKVQREFVTEEVHTIRELLPNTHVSFERKAVHKDSPEFSRRFSTFRQKYLRVLKVEKVENAALALLFELKKKQLSCSTTRNMFQRVPAQFCDMVSYVGFHAECAPPDDPAYGEGIYFAGSIEKASDMWTGQKDEYLYFVEAEVIAGKSTAGNPGVILPPPVGSDPQTRYDSVSGGADVSVIFSSYQALPKYIITCQSN